MAANNSVVKKKFVVLYHNYQQTYRQTNIQKSKKTSWKSATNVLKCTNLNKYSSVSHEAAEYENVRNSLKLKHTNFVGLYLVAENS